MRTRLFSVILLVVLMVSMVGNAKATPQSSSDPKALLYVELASPDDLSRFTSTLLPIYTFLEEGLLTGAGHADQQVLSAAGLNFLMLDPVLGSGSYYLATTHSSRPMPDLTAYGQVLLDTSNGALLRMQPSEAASLSQAGAELMLITLTPKPLPAAQREAVFPEVIIPDPLIQEMMDLATLEQVYQYDRELAGELPVWVDNDWYTITSRYTYSNTPIQKTMHYMYQHMESLGLDVEYHQWGGLTYPNVIGEITGSTNPEDIFIIGGHIDDVQGTPGADDNASGSVATLLAADILSQYQWGCTLRFALWTGEEQGLDGSSAYAQRSYNMDENIVGYLNLDMIAWNTIGSQPTIYLGYGSSVPPSHDLANLFADVVDAYNINLLPVIGTQFYGSSDHTSFLQYGYPAILGIEGIDDFNPYYHGPEDNTTHTDPAYFTNFVKASIGTFAHMSDCLIPDADGALDGHVTAAGSGAPLEGATVTADNGQGDTYPSNTDASGYYTMTLPADTYTVTTILDGYYPLSQSATITEGVVTTLDFNLVPVCDPVNGLDFTWMPLDPYNGDVITFTATASGTEPVDFLWSFGDTFTSTGTTVTHAYAEANTYSVELYATNACSTASANKDITVLQRIREFFLPLLNK